MKQFQTREELLQDAINYYWGRPERRCVDNSGSCVYSPTETSEGCAIGRLLPLDISERLNDGTGVSDSSIFNELPEWLQDMGVDFLQALQIIHDLEYFVYKSVGDISLYMKKWVDLTKITFPE